MSGVLDENVVILRFDNSDFEKNTKQSMDTLDKLKSSVDGASKESFGNLDKAANSVNLSGLGKAIDTINSRFSNLGIMGAAALNRLTNSAITSAKNIVMAIPNQMKQGGWKRALNIEQAEFLMKGLGYTFDGFFDDVTGKWEGYKGAVLASVKNTAYGMDEAAKAAASLLASLPEDAKSAEDLVHHLKAISGVAAVTSSDYESISYIFTKVAGQGRMMGDELNQLSNKGFNAAAQIAKYLSSNKDLANSALDTAIALGKQSKKMEEIKTHTEITESDVREMVSAGAISFDIMSKSLEGFFDTASEANKTFSGSLANVKASLSRMGAKLMEPKLKNLTLLFNHLLPVLQKIEVLITPFTNKIANASKAITNFIGFGIINPVGELLGVEKLFTGFGDGAEAVAKKVTGANEEIKDSSKKTREEILKGNKEYQAARDIWYKGTYGNGSKRKNALEEIGISYKKTQDIINQFYRDGFKWDNIEKQLIKDYNDRAGAAEDAAEANDKASESVKEYPTMVALVKAFVNTISAFYITLKSIGSIIVATGRAIIRTLTPAFKTGANVFLKFSEHLLEGSKRFSSFLTTMVTGSGKSNKVWVGFVNAISNGVKLIGSGIVFAKDVIVGLFTGIKEFISQFSQTEGFDALKEQLSDLVGVLKDLAGGALKTVTDQLGKLSNIGASSNMSKVVGFFSGLASNLANMIAAIRRGENPLKGFIGIFGRVKEALSFNSLTKNGVTAGVNAISAKNGTVAMVINATESIRKANIPKTFNSASESIFNFFSGLSGKVKEIDVKGTLMKVLEAFKNADWEGISKVAFRIGSLAAIFKTVHDMSRMVDAAIGTLGSISGFFGSLSGLVKAQTGAIKARNFEMIALSVAILIGSIVALAAVPTDRLIPAMSGVIILVGMLVGVMTLMTSSKFDPTKITAVGMSFAAMGASILLLAMACKLMAGIDGEGLFKAGAAITIFMGMFILAGKMKGEIMASGAAFLAMAGAINLLVFAIGAFAVMPWGAILKGATAVGIIMTELVVAARIAGMANPAGLLAMAAALDLLIPAIVIFSIMPAEQAMKGAVIACSILAMIGLASRTAAQGTAMTSLISMSLMVGTLAAALVVLSLIDSNRLAVATLALTNTLLAISIAAEMAKKSVAGMLTVSLVIGMMTAAIVALTKMGAEKALASSASLSALVLSLGVALSLMSAVPIGAAVTGALGMAAGMGIIVGAITVIIMALGGIAQIPKAKWLLNEGKKFAKQLGEAIGGFVGGIVAGAGKAMTSGMVSMADDLAAFSEKIQPFLTMAKGIDEKTTNGVKHLADAILSIAKAEFVDSLSFSGAGDLANKMKDLGDGFVEFSKVVDEIPDDIAEKSGKIAKIISTLASAFGDIPKSNGLAQTFTGYVDVDAFVDGLLSVAKALGKNGKMKAGLAELDIPDDLLGENGKITKIAEVIKTMSSAVNKIPKTGGLQQKFTGWANVSDFADGMLKFATSLGNNQEGIQSLSNIEIPDGLTAEGGKITKICDVIVALSNAANQIPESEGIKQGILGNTTINEFAEQLANAIPSLETFINAVGNKDLKFGEGIKEKIIRIASAIGAMATASQQIPETGGFKQVVFGGQDVSNFASKLAAAIPGLQTFADGVSEMKIGKAVMAKIPNITEAIKAMAECAKALPKSNGVWQRLTGQKDIGNFGKQLKTLIESLDGIDASNVNSGSIGKAANALNSIVPAVQAFKGVMPIPTGANLARLGENAVSFVNSLGSVSTKGISAKASSISSAASKLSAQAVKGVNSAGKSANVSSAGSSIANSFLSGINGRLSSARSAGKSLAKNAKSGAASVSLNSTGKSVGQGFINGINSKKGEAYRSGRALGYQAKKGAKNAVDSNSPAKEFIKIGKYSGEGLVIGLQSYERKVYKKSYEVGESSLKGATDGLGDFLADTPNPVITPVIDLSEVDRGLNTLNNDFSRNRTFGIDSTFQSNDYKANKMMNDMVSALNKMNDDSQPATNYFTFNVDGAENPEEFAQRFVRQIQLEMRTG